MDKYIFNKIIIEPILFYKSICEYGNIFNKSLENYFVDPINNKLNQIKAIRVFRDPLNRSWWTEDNRRLWSFKESKLLRLNCNKARKILKWKSILKFEETVDVGKLTTKVDLVGKLLIEVTHSHDGCQRCRVRSKVVKLNNVHKTLLHISFRIVNSETDM